MRQSVAQAAWAVSHRSAFGSLLIDKPLMQNVIADLEIEVEAATLMITRLSGAHERSTIDPEEAAFARLATPVAKYWLTKQSTPVVREALECLGGNGYVEDSILPRLYREAPLNAIWEGSGNVIALDMNRAVAKSPESLEAFLSELECSAGSHPPLKTELDLIRQQFTDVTAGEANSRRLIERLAVAWSSALLIAHGNQSVADAYLRSRLGGDHGSQFGTLPTDCDLAGIAQRAVPGLI